MPSHHLKTVQQNQDTGYFIFLFLPFVFIYKHLSAPIIEFIHVLNMSANFKVLIDRYLASEAKSGIFLQFFLDFFPLDFIRRVYFARNDLHHTTGTQTTPPTIENFQNVGIKADILLDSRFSKVSTNFYRNKPFFLYEFNLWHKLTPPPKN